MEHCSTCDLNANFHSFHLISSDPMLMVAFAMFINNLPRMRGILCQHPCLAPRNPPKMHKSRIFTRMPYANPSGKPFEKTTSMLLHFFQKSSTRHASLATGIKNQKPHASSLVRLLLDAISFSFLLMS